MDTGRLNQRVTIQQRAADCITENGLQQEQWSDFYCCWTYVNNLSGTEFWSAHAVQAEDTVVFTVRYCKKIAVIDTRNYRLVFNNAVYNILFVDHVRYEKDIVKIKARRQSAEVSV